MLLLATALLAADPPKAPPKPPPSATVVLEDRPLELPRLPRDAAQGRGQFKAVHASIGTALGDLTLALRDLYARPEARRPLPPDLSVPEAMAAEGADLVNLLDDPGARRLEIQLMDAWRGWQAALVEEGLATPVQAAPPAPGARSRAFQEARAAAVAALRKPARRAAPVDRLDAGYLEEVDLFPEAPVRPSPEEVRLYGGQEAALARIQKRLAVSGTLLTHLSAPWDALVAHLARQAETGLRWESPHPAPSDPAMDALRVQARIALLERFRLAFWLCDAIWSDTAAAGPPAPLPRLSGP